MNRKLEGRVALVTGGSSGIGLATAERFVAEGAFVYITGRRQAQLDAAVSKIGSNVKDVQADVSKPADLDRLYAQIKKEKGRLDTVFANAGGGTFLPLGSITEQQYHETFDNNVKGAIHYTALRLRRCGPTCSTGMRSTRAGISPRLSNQNPFTEELRKAFRSRRG